VTAEPCSAGRESCPPQAVRRAGVVGGGALDRPVLLVLGDSLAFHGPERAEPADEPRLWPNVTTAALGGRAEIVAGVGWTARHAWHALISDPRVWALLPHVDALVLGVGGMDALPSPVPTALRELIPVLRPPAAQGGAGRVPARLNPCWRRRSRPRSPEAVRWRCRPDSPSPTWSGAAAPCSRCARSSPSSRCCPPRTSPSPTRRSIRAVLPRSATRAWAAASGVDVLDVPALVADHVFGGHGNPDGMHWGWSAHASVGAACADLLRPRLGGRVPDMA
jgi:hypothetical protein